MDQREADDELLELLAYLSPRPLDFVYAAFPWGEPGTELETRPGPELWQQALLGHMQMQLLQGYNLGRVISDALQVCVKSGHDIGKSACVCWIILWAVSTREDTKGVVTANTEKQLRLKLWAELAKWHRLFIGSRFFKVTATSIQATDPAREKEWRIDAIPWSEDNPEAFAGLHNYGKRVLVVFDEASGIVDKIWETIDGVMSEADTELIWVATGNPTRNIGRFRECFDKSGQGQFWHTFTVDSREVSFTNKARIQAQIELWGIDHDFIKVRWLGQFPESGISQLIPSDAVRHAMVCDTIGYDYQPLILAVDVARFGDNESVAVLRRGKDARSLPTNRWRKTSTIELAQSVASLISRYNPDAVFVDEGGVGGGVIDYLRMLGYAIAGVNFGASAMMPLGGEKCYNKRAEIYCSLRTWLQQGGAIPNDQDLFRQIISIEYGHSKSGRLADAILLTPKEELDESPDWADALAMTFAFPVATKIRNANKITSEYDPLSLAAFQQASMELH